MMKLKLSAIALFTTLAACGSDSTENTASTGEAQSPQVESAGGLMSLIMPGANDASDQDKDYSASRETAIAHTNLTNTVDHPVYARLAECGPGSRREPGVQGQVPLEQRQNGDSELGYHCNLEMLGQWQGEGSTWVSDSYKDCAYMATAFGTTGTLFKKYPGVQVLDVSDVSNPSYVKSLNSPAYLNGTWETLHVNESRELLGGVAVGIGLSAGFFDIYDLSGDCKNPKLMNSLVGNLSLPANVVGHEGQWAPDGNTYYSTGLTPGGITAIDTSDPTAPRILYTTVVSPTNHGFELSPDGNRMYLSSLAPAGIMILDTSSIQNRETIPQMPLVGAVTWLDGNLGQHAMPVFYGDKPYVIEVSEHGTGGVRFIDITDETKPFVATQIKLGIQHPENFLARTEDTLRGGFFGYEAHYCDTDRRINPTALACGWMQSGVRVFDIRDPLNVKEIAYFNPPAKPADKLKLHGSEHAGGWLSLGITDLTTDWCSSPPRFVNDNELWLTCQDNGFMTLRFTNGAYPLK